MKKKDYISPILSSQDFSDYLEGRLSLEEKQLFEEKLESNAFLKDAFEGFRAQPKGIESLSKLGRKKKPSNLKLVAFGLVSFVFLISLLALSYSAVQKGIEIKSSLAETDLAIETEVGLKKNEELNNQEKTNLKQKVKQELVYTKIVEEEKLKERAHEVLVFKDATEENKLETLTYFENKNKIKKLEANPNLELETKTIPLISIHGLINVNYEKIEDNNTIEIETFSINSTPANQENLNRENNEPSHKTRIIKVSYVKYLSDIQFQFSRNNFKKALKGYGKILEQYPNDLNAHFYSAICYYNINQSEKALAHLEIVEKHKYNTFSQEGKWYKASVLYDLDKKDACIELLDSIVKKNGFYSEQAKEMKIKISKI